VIDEMQLAAALGEQSRWGRRLGVTLIKMGMVEETHLVRALASQLSLPVASLAGKRISDDVIALVPARVASEHGVIPLFVKEKGHTVQLFLGMEDPSDLDVLDDLGFRTGMEIHPVMVGPSELGEAIDRYYLGSKAAASSQSSVNAASGALAGEAIGELNLRLVTPDEVPPGLVPAEPAPVSTADATERPPEPRDTEIESNEPSPQLPEGLLEEIAQTIDETGKTRIVARAIAQLLIQKGILTLEEVQASIAQQKGDAAS
jgi:hypothetical protein